VQMCYPFEMLQPTRLTAGLLADTFARMNAVAPDAWPCWAYSNHDVIRHITRWSLSDQAAKTYTTLLMCLRGSVCLYQGEELGLPEADIAYADLQDPYGIQFWPEFKGRDGCRTPMPWVTDNANAGFSDAKPWLPVVTPHLPRSVAAQDAEAGSMLRHYRAALAMRRAHPALMTGDMTMLATEGEVARFIRTADETIFCAFNLSDQPAPCSLPAGIWTALDARLGTTAPQGPSIMLGPWGACLAKQG
jgi:alpha-glucosidase